MKRNYHFFIKSSRILGRGPMLNSSSKQITFNLGFVGACNLSLQCRRNQYCLSKRMIRGWNLFSWRNWLKKMALRLESEKEANRTLDFFPFISKYVPWTLMTCVCICFTSYYLLMNHLSNSEENLIHKVLRAYESHKNLFVWTLESPMRNPEGNANLRNGWQYHDNRDKLMEPLLITWYR